MDADPVKHGIMRLIDDLDETGAPSLVWAVAWSADGEDPFTAAWNASRAPVMMFQIAARFLPPKTCVQIAAAAIRRFAREGDAPVRDARVKHVADALRAVANALGAWSRGPLTEARAGAVLATTKTLTALCRGAHRGVFVVNAGDMAREIEESIESVPYFYNVISSCAFVLNGGWDKTRGTHGDDVFSGLIRRHVRPPPTLAQAMGIDRSRLAELALNVHLR